MPALYSHGRKADQSHNLNGLPAGAGTTTYTKGYPKGSWKRARWHSSHGALFSPKNPLLKFNEMRDRIEIDEQMGLLELFKGAVLAIRNVFHHKSRNHQENPYITIEYLQFASFLAKKLDLAKPVKENS
jgi:hypothetical protein